MKIEIEAKFAVDDAGKIADQVVGLGGSLVADMLEVNVFVDSSQRKLKTSDRGLRVRSVYIDGQLSKTEVTFKGRRRPGKLKSRREIEFNVETAEPMLALLAELGYQESIRFEKRRTRYHMDGCTIELDEMPYLGTFVEIEGPSDEAVLEKRSKLGCDEIPLIKSSYASMLDAYLHERGITERDIRFDNVNSGEE